EGRRDAPALRRLQRDDRVADRPQLALGGATRAALAQAALAPAACARGARAVPRMPPLAVPTVEQHVHVAADELVTEVAQNIGVAARDQEQKLRHAFPLHLTYCSVATRRATAVAWLSSCIIDALWRPFEIQVHRACCLRSRVRAVKNADGGLSCTKTRRGEGAAPCPTARRSLPFARVRTRVTSPSITEGKEGSHADLHGAGVLHERGVEPARPAAGESDGGAAAGDREAGREAPRLVLLLGRLRRDGALRRAR